MIHQLRQIARAGRSGQEVRKVEKFTLGDLVRITQGPFYGIEGYVKKDEGKTMIVLNVEILGQAVALSILPSWCEKIEK
jgi:transcription antitermination factor NusG